MLRIFIYAFSPFILFGEASVQIFVAIFGGYFAILLLCFKRSFHILDTRLLLDVFCKSFLPLCGLSFDFLTMPLTEQTFLNFNKVTLSFHGS